MKPEPSAARRLARRMSILVLVAWIWVWVCALTGNLSGIIPVLGWLPSDLWTESIDVTWPWILLVMVIYSLVPGLAWVAKDKGMALMVVIFPILGALLFALRFAGGMGAFR